MSRETAEWRLQNFQVGFVKEHGPAWHGKVGDPNMHEGPVPIEVMEDLFDWEAEKVPVYIEVPTDEFSTGLDDDGNIVSHPIQKFAEIPKRYAVVDSRDHTNAFQVGVSVQYKVHQYKRWLLDEVATLFDVEGANLAIGSGGLTQMGGVAWIQVRPPEGITIAGDRMIPWLLASTGHNGSIVTSYAGVITRAVCDNTLSMALTERGNRFSVRHTTNSLNKLAQAREAIGMFYEDTAAFTQEVERMMNTAVTDDQFRALVDTLEPEAPADATQQIMNSANARRGTLLNLWANDPRVGDFKGTKWGALNAFNTRDHWETGGPTSKTAERQMKRTAAGDVARDDRRVLATLDSILVGA